MSTSRIKSNNHDAIHARIAAIDKERLLNAHVRGDVYFALTDSFGIKQRTAYAIVRRIERKGVVRELP